MTLPHPHWIRMAETTSPLRSSVIVGFEQFSGEADGPAASGMKGSKADCGEAWVRIFTLWDALTGSFDEGAGARRGINSADMALGFVLKFCRIGRLTVLSHGG